MGNTIQPCTECLNKGSVDGKKKKKKGSRQSIRNQMSLEESGDKKIIERSMKDDGIQTQHSSYLSGVKESGSSPRNNSAFSKGDTGLKLGVIEERGETQLTDENISGGDLKNGVPDNGLRVSQDL